MRHNTGVTKEREGEKQRVEEGGALHLACHLIIADIYVHVHILNVCVGKRREQMCLCVGWWVCRFVRALERTLCTMGTLFVHVQI